MKKTYLVIDGNGRLSYEEKKVSTVIRIIGASAPAMLKKIEEALTTLCPLGYDNSYYIPRPGNFVSSDFEDKIKEIHRFEKAIQNHIKDSLLRPMKKYLITTIDDNVIDILTTTNH